MTSAAAQIPNYTEIEISRVKPGEGPVGEWLPGRMGPALAGGVGIVFPKGPKPAEVFSEGALVRVKFLGETALFWFDTNVTGFGAEGIVVLAEPLRVFRAQRRDFVRLEISLPVRYRVDSGEAVYSGRTLDLSAGGMALLGTSDFPKGTLFRLEVDLMEFGLFNIVGEVLWSKPVDLGRTEKYRFGVRFTGIDEGTQDRITSFIFSHQSRLRRLGLL